QSEEGGGHAAQHAARGHQRQAELVRPGGAADAPLVRQSLAQSGPLEVPPRCLRLCVLKNYSDRTHAIASVLVGIFLGLCYINLGDGITGLQNRSGALFFILTLVSFSTLSALDLCAPLSSFLEPYGFSHIREADFHPRAG